MDPRRLEKYKYYFRMYFGMPQVLRYMDYEFFSHHQWFRFSIYLGASDAGCQHLTAEQIENEVQELSNSFKEFILLFQ